VPARDRRTIGELLAGSDALARETLLDATPENARAMVRSWNQLVASAVHLWAALASRPDSMSGSDPMERLRVVGQAIGRSVRAGHWPGHGPTDDHLSEISDNFSRTRHLIERHDTANTNRDAHTPGIRGQVMHTLYVAAHGTAVALGAYVGELQHRLEVGTRRRQPMAERPTILEITEAQGMIARFGGFEPARGGLYVRAATPLRGPWQAESGGTGHAAGNSPGRLGGSGAPHPSDKSGFG